MEKKQFQTLVQDKEIQFKKKKKNDRKNYSTMIFTSMLVFVFKGNLLKRWESAKKKKKLNNVFTCGLIIIIIFRLCHVAVQVTIYIARKLYFILFIGHVSIFHQSLNGRDYFNIIPKG